MSWKDIEIERMPPQIITAPFDIEGAVSWESASHEITDDDIKIEFGKESKDYTLALFRDGLLFVMRKSRDGEEGDYTGSLAMCVRIGGELFSASDVSGILNALQREWVETHHEDDDLEEEDT